jgi:integrase
MSVRKRKWTTRKGEAKEAWIVDYVDQQGGRHIETFERKKDADAYHATVRVDISKGMHTPPNKSLAVKEAAEVWIKRVEADGRERTTVRQYRQHVNLHIAPRLGATKIAQLNVPRIEAFRDDLLASMTRAMARKVLTSLKSLLKAVGHSHVMANVTIKRMKRDKRKIEAGVDFPESAEVARLINAATDSRLRALLMVAGLCGLRASELRGLRWADVDFPGGEIHVRQRADRYGKIGSPKSESSVRRVPLSPEAGAALRKWKIGRTPSDADLVFPTSTGAVEHHSNMLRSLAPIMVAAGVLDKSGNPKYALHAFRHFFASWCLNPVDRGGLGLGGSPKEVQTLLGHSSIVMTLDIYGHLFPAGGESGKRLAAASAALFA